MNKELRWGLISGEYPPAAGGVADYTAQLAAALAEAGDEVHVWAPEPATATPGVTVHPLPDRFGRRGRHRLEEALQTMQPKLRLLIQYVPHAFGCKAMNLPFCRWVYRQRDDQPWVMFHEVAYPREPGQSARHRLLAAVTRRMAILARRAAGESFVSVPAWGEWLDEMTPGHRPSQWLPVPSNLPTTVPRERIAAVRQQLMPDGGLLLGSFGSFGGHARDCLRRLLPELLHRDEHRHALFAGPGGEQLRSEIASGAPTLRRRMHAPGFLAGTAAAAHLAATDCMIQPYPDGVSGRRGTAMAALALGRALVTHEGRFTEPLWRTSGAVRLAMAPSQPEALANALQAAAESVLDNPAEREALGAAGQRFYQEHFALEHTVRILRDTARGATS